MSKSFRAVQISLDFIIPSETDGNDLAERILTIVNNHFDNLTHNICCVGAMCYSDDIFTDYYRDMIDEMEL